MGGSSPQRLCAIAPSLDDDDDETTTTTSALTSPVPHRNVFRLVFTDGVTKQQDEDKGETGTDEHMVAADNVGTRDLATLANLDEKTILSELKLRYGTTRHLLSVAAYHRLCQRTTAHRPPYLAAAPSKSSSVLPRWPKRV